MEETNWLVAEWVVYCPKCSESFWNFEDEEKVIHCCCGYTFKVKSKE